MPRSFFAGEFITAIALLFKKPKSQESETGGGADFAARGDDLSVKPTPPPNSQASPDSTAPATATT
jgi:hypothetical protein